MNGKENRGEKEEKIHSYNNIVERRKTVNLNLESKYSIYRRKNHKKMTMKLIEILEKKYIYGEKF